MDVDGRDPRPSTSTGTIGPACQPDQFGQVLGREGAELEFHGVALWGTKQAEGVH